MALTAEQQAQVDIQLAVENARHANLMALEQLRINANNANIQSQVDAQIESTRAAMKQIKLEVIRLAKETLIENARSQPVDSREVTVAAITAFASALEAHINT